MDKFAPTSFSQLIEMCVEDFQTHDSDLARPGLRALWVHRFGKWRMGVKKPFRAPLTLIYRIAEAHARNCGSELPYSAKIGRRVKFEHQGHVVHGNAIIGNNCVIRQNTTLGNRHHPADAPTLGEGVSVGAGAVLIGDIRVGNGAKIGANAVVTQDVPLGATAVGVQARIILRNEFTLEPETTAAVPFVAASPSRFFK